MTDIPPQPSWPGALADEDHGDRGPGRGEPWDINERRELLETWREVHRWDEDTDKARGDGAADRTAVVHPVAAAQPEEGDLERGQRSSSGEDADSGSGVGEWSVGDGA